MTSEGGLLRRGGSSSPCQASQEGKILKAAEQRRSIAHHPETLVKVEELLVSYPDVNGDERDFLAAFLRNGAPIDIGLLSSNAQAWAAAERFRSENPDYFRTGPRVYAAWAAVIGALALALWAMKDMGLN